MIQFTGEQRQVHPRLSFFGFVKPWVGGSEGARKELVSPLEISKAKADRFVPAVPAPSQLLRFPEVNCMAAEALEIFNLDFVQEDRRRSEEGSDYVASGEGNGDRSLAWLLSAILQPPLAVLLEEGVLNWPFPLLEHQKVGIAALLHNRQLLLADEMGLGKTIQVLAALRILAHRRLTESCLIVAPASLLRQWQVEAKLWAKELTFIRVSGPAGHRAALWRLPAHAHLVAYETLREDIGSRWVASKTWDVLVLDEASRIKNSESQVSTAVNKLKGARKWALTGTPIENRVEDLQSLLSFLIPDPALRRGDLNQILSQVQLRRRKDGVLHDLPEKTVISVPLELEEAQRAAYDTAETHGIFRLRSLGADLTISHVLELLIRLKQICNVDPATSRSAKLEDLEGRLEQLSQQGHRALVFSQFTDGVFGIEMLTHRLGRFQPLSFTGAMSPSVRDEVIKRFSTDDRHKVLILSLKAGGVGLNLQSASYVFHLDRWWNPAIEDQAEARAHRMGQRHPVTVYRYICQDTIEERIERVLSEKRELFQRTVEGIVQDLPNVLKQRELFGLFGLDAPEGN